MAAGFALFLTTEQCVSLAEQDIRVLHNMNHYIFYNERGQIIFEGKKEQDSWQTLQDQGRQKESIQIILKMFQILSQSLPNALYFHYQNGKCVQKKISGLPYQIPRYLLVSKSFSHCPIYTKIQLAGIRRLQNKLEVFVFKESSPQQVLQNSGSALSSAPLNFSQSQSSVEENHVEINTIPKWVYWADIKEQVEVDALIHFFYHLFVALNQASLENGPFLLEGKNAHLPHRILKTYLPPPVKNVKKNNKKGKRKREQSENKEFPWWEFSGSPEF
jgi:hypothetical protein